MKATPAEVLQVYRMERDLMERWYPKARAALGKKPACRQGCATCCVYDQPPLTILEATALVHYCRTHPGFEDVLVAVEKAGEQIVDMLEVQGQKFMPRDHPLQCCPMLDREAGRCRIYELRPTACVFAYSEDATKCQKSVMAADGMVGWDIPVAEQEATIEKMLRMLPGDARTKFTQHLQIRTQNNTGSMMLSVAMALVMRPDLHKRVVACVQKEATTNDARGTD